MLEIIEERLTTAAAHPLSDVPCSLFKELLWGWHSLAPADVQAWLWEQIGTERWSLIDLITHYSSTDMTPDGHPLPDSVFDNLDVAEINGLLGLARIFEYLKEALDAVQYTERPKPGDGYQDQIKKYILWIFRDMRGRIATTADENSDDASS